jgi:V/A-type H+-transporting ATPase subunit D
MRDIPSKMALLERRAELALVSQGKSVLEERRDILARELLDLIRQCETLVEAFETYYQTAWQALQYAILRHGITSLMGFEAYFKENAPDKNPHWSMLNRAGVNWLEAEKLPEPSVPMTSGSGVRSPEVQTAFNAFHDLQASGFKLAQSENNLQRMSLAFKSVQQRVNALEHIILPETTRAIKSIEEGLEQIDREHLVGVLWLKRQMV